MRDVVCHGRMSSSRWPRSPSLVTCSPTTCTASAGSDRSPCQHDIRVAARGCRRRDGVCLERGPNSKLPRRQCQMALLHPLRLASSRRQIEASCPSSDSEPCSTRSEDLFWGIPFYGRGVAHRTWKGKINEDLGFWIGACVLADLGERGGRIDRDDEADQRHWPNQPRIP